MRFVDLKRFIEVREKLSLRISVFYSAPIGIAIFILVLISGEFLAGLVSGVLVAGGLFALIFVLRKMTHSGVERKRSRIDWEAPYIDVIFRGEMGALQIFDDGLRYQGLTPGGAEKEFFIEINEDLFISVGEIKYTKFQSKKYGDLKQGHITTREMPHGVVRQFIFYDIDGLLDKLAVRIEEVSKFDIEKYK